MSKQWRSPSTIGPAAHDASGKREQHKGDVNGRTDTRDVRDLRHLAGCESGPFKRPGHVIGLLRLAQHLTAGRDIAGKRKRWQQQAHAGK